MDYLVTTEFGVKTGRHDRTIYQRIFGTSETLLQIFSGVDERVFYLRDSFPETAMSQFAFGLFSNWDPKDITVGSSMPDLSISPKPVAREPQSEESRVLSPHQEEEDATPSEFPSTSPEPALPEDPDTPFRPTPRRTDSWKTRNPRPESPRGWGAPPGQSREEGWGGATPGPRRDTDTRDRMSGSRYGQAPYGAYDPSNPLNIWPPPPTSRSVRDAFLRPPATRSVGQRFEEFSILDDISDLLRALPPLPENLYTFDTQHSEWSTFVLVSCFVIVLTAQSVSKLIRHLM